MSLTSRNMLLTAILFLFISAAKLSVGETKEQQDIGNGATPRPASERISNQRVLTTRAIININEDHTQVPPPADSQSEVIHHQQQQPSSSKLASLVHHFQNRPPVLNPVFSNRKYTLLGNSTQSRTSGNLYHSSHLSLPHPFGSTSKFASPISLISQDESRIKSQSVTNQAHQELTTVINQQQANNQQQKQRAGLLDKICIGTSNGLSSQRNKSDHYQNLYERYKNCTYVIGNLEITWLEKTSGNQGGDKQQQQQDQELDLSFLESIREITGYLLIAHVDVAKIRMPNLQIIRGRDLFKFHDADDKEEFALMLVENELKSLELPNLSEILTGSVGSYNNRHLCHIRTIEWEEILGPNFKSIFVYNGAQPECPACDSACLGHCWAEGPEMCQKFSKMGCAPTCAGRCVSTSAGGLTPSECCHEFCAGGCTGPNQTDCLACKNFHDNGSCVQECPSLMRYNSNYFLWEPNPNGKFAFGATCVRECPENMLRDSGACVRVCPLNKRSLNGECVPCGGPCPKNCQGVEVVNSDNIDQLINCTVIEGSITILDKSFNGYTEDSQSSAASGTAASQNRTATATTTTITSTVKHKPMHPSRLDVFKTLREITGYLDIKAKHADFKDLSYFTNLKTIGGRHFTAIHALSITRSSLVSLNLRSLRRIGSGKINIEENPELCFADTIDWRQIEIISREDVTTRNNAEASKCRAAGLQCHEQCSPDGCWGPGPDECLSCNNYKVDDYCVVNCSSTESLGFLSYEDPNQRHTCKRCHAECSQGCSGPEASHCHACKSVKDGPYCVPECPSHKYNNNGTCALCHESCGPDGCSGPSNKLGEGGCNSCDKAISRASDIATTTTTTTAMAGFEHLQQAFECIRAVDPCPEGYYQEYVVGSSQPDGSPLKSSSGRPVCRKCHHRCKSCIGMGTHKTVCVCAKYVAGEQCEDHCPRDYYADEESRQCVRCSPECNGCYGPTEADCISCRVYRIYYEPLGSPAHQQPVASAQVISAGGGGETNPRLRFNCTAQCPSDKPHRISESNMLDPYCSEDPGIDLESPLIVSMSSTSILFMVIISAALMVCVSIYRCQIERDKTYKMTMRLSGLEDVEPLTPSHLKPNLASLRSIQESELSEGKELGSGFGGTVYEGFWRPEGKEHRHAIPVAIKKLRDNGQSNINKEFLEEAYIMASVDHPNLVRLLAVCMTPKNLMLVTKLMPLGCLLDFVKKSKQSISSKNLLEWGKQIARGMAYLEERRLVHRDLALRNVLLQTPGKALISDFGLAKFLEVNQSEYQSGGGRLPIKWLAPECFRERKFTHKSDVWAFGVTIWELVTFGHRPFEEFETRDVPLVIEQGTRLKQPKNVTIELYKVMMSCWFYTPEDRPSFKQLVQSFVTFARDPQRYLICGAKGIELCKGLSANGDQDVGDYEEEEEEEVDEEYDCEVAGDEADDSQGDANVSPTSLVSSQPPLGSTMGPDLTPSTHNRLNEMFGFEMQRSRASESSELNGHSSSLTTPIFKNPNGQFIEPDDVFMRRAMSKNNGHNHHHQHQHHHHLHHHQHQQRGRPQLASTSSKAALISPDINNNNPPFANNNQTACWPMHHTVSSNSLGQRSEQPTDMYDYLLPSPCTNGHGNTFSTFYPGSFDNPSASLTVRNPPHSAGIVSNITNEEYFLTTSANYVNENTITDVTNHNQHNRLSTSNGNIPQSLV